MTGWILLAGGATTAVIAVMAAPRGAARVCVTLGLASAVTGTLLILAALTIGATP